MKYILFILFSFLTLQINAQTDTIIKPPPQQEKIQHDKEKNTGSDYYNSYTRAIIGLKDHSVLHVNQITTHNSDVMVEYDPKKLPLNPIYNIKVENISYVKFKRGTFVKGMCAGAVIGAMIGGLYLKINSDERNSLRRTLYVVSGIITLGLTGGIIGSVFIKKKFFINGDREKMDSIIRRM
ncbi:MAG TPA: hypothetical protein VMY77_15340 [Chitinophagaceae bacterium]|nr:hypothetical protein [Chitinophagaceae bacterium]